ncbi:acyl-CoA dehydrogenase family protein [Micromonospora echinofusca]|uniref:Acyl-CoA dehydrogenase n=1 Tax=Micromonospora echinofusca TaxID=47858 RepID=A0A1C5GFL1_MICEH|nr:acyl-CoA dehydrogenase family protein [Micromonospora echinofusca]SCG18603.1 acyl-CoA dehydrogenase [Micromonospora echinofusca]
MSTATGHESALEEVLAAAAAHAEHADETAEFPTAALDAMRATGLLGLLVPAEHGGGGGGLDDLVDVTLRLARVDMSVALIFAMHCQQVAAVVRHADGPFAERLLPELGKGDVYLASVTTERGKGGHLLSSESTVRQDAGTLTIDRDAPIVTGGQHADAYLITTLAPDATSPTQVSLVYARRDQLTLEVRGGWQPLGMRATQSVPMRLTGRVPADQVIGAPGKFREIVAPTFGPLAHIGWSAAWLGAATGALSRILHHIRDAGRGQFDPSSELLLTRLARVRGRLDLVNALLRHTVAAVQGTPDVADPSTQLLVNSLKVHAAEQCFAAADEMVELVGLRHGYLRSSPLYLERVFRDLRSASLNYANDRLLLVNGALTLRDRQVHLA